MDNNIILKEHLFDRAYIAFDCNEMNLLKTYNRTAIKAIVLLTLFLTQLPLMSYFFFSGDLWFFTDISTFAFVVFNGYLFYVVKAYRIKARDFNSGLIAIISRMKFLDDFIPTKPNDCFVEAVKECSEKITTQLLLRR